MGYLFLTIALFAGTTKGYCGKKTSRFVQSYSDASFANMLRMLFCIAIGLGMIIFQKSILDLRVSIPTLLICALSGITISIFTITWLISVKHGAYMMIDVFLTLGCVVPMVISHFMFGEIIKPLHWVGFGILLIAVFIMCSYSISIKGSISPMAYLMLVICGVSNGLNSLSQKMFIKMSENSNIAVFNFYSYIFAALVLFVFFRIFSKKDENKEELQLKRIFVYILVMSVCLFLNSFFQTKAALHLEASQIYPLSQGASLILGSVMSLVCFGEKITLKSFIGILITFAGLIVMNVFA